MAGLFDSLTIAGNAVGGQQFGAQVAGANIASAQSPGYHREDVVLQSSGLGAGNVAPQMVRASNQFVEQNVYLQAGASAYAQMRQTGLLGVQAAVGDLGSTGLGAALSNFFAGWRGIASNPGDVSTRIDAMGKITALVNNVNGAAQALQQAQTQADLQVVQTVAAANAQITQIAQLNSAIQVAQASGTTPGALYDQRDAAVQTLAQSLGTTSGTDANGQVFVLLGGVSLVSGDNAYSLNTSVDAATGLHHIVIDDTTQGVLDSRITAGTLGGLISLRDVDVVASQYALDQFAFDLTNAVNAVHVTGTGLDGISGRNLLAPHAQIGAAAALSVDGSVLGNPQALAASSAQATLPGDGRIALAMAQLEGAAVAASNTLTLAQSLGSMVASVGSTLAAANADVAQQQLNLLAVQNIAESQIGVSMQDQLLQLSRYEYGFEAATRLISTVDSMLDSLLNM